MIEQLDLLDRKLFLFLNGLHADWLDQPMYLFSEPLFWIPVYLILLFSIGKKFNWQTALYALCGIGLVILLCDRISVELFKEVFERFRPTHNPEIENLVHVVNGWDGKPYRGGSFGFVSSHAANYFGIASFVFFVLKPTRNIALLIFTWATLVSYSRIYLGVHYPGDILGGAILGFLLAALSYQIWKWVMKNWIPIVRGVYMP